MDHLCSSLAAAPSRRLLALLAVLAATSLASSLARSEPVETVPGPVQGSASDGVLSYLGIPFAAPPVESLRWKAPVAPEPWSEPLKANQFSATCGPAAETEAPIAEDCLYLNLWTSALSGTRPVMLWIHGGGFRAGSGRLPDEFARAMVEQGVVLVSIQYRLGVMGFFAHEVLDEEVANFGLLDMVIALKWVQENIAQFGGDANRVTIFGSSAGGMAVQMLMTSPLSAGLFTGAIAQSGYGTWPLPDREEAEKQAEILASRAGIAPHQASPEKLREVSADEWAQTFSTFQLPIIDGLSLIDEPAQVFARGTQHPLPMILGNTSFEGTTITGAGYSADTYFDTWGERAKRARELYASDMPLGEEVATKRFFGDVRYVVGSRLIAHLNSDRAASYLYYFDHVPTSMRGSWAGAPHGFASSVLFASSPAVAEGPSAEETRELGRLLRGYWSNFAHSGDPNGEGLPLWSRYEPENDNWLVFRDQASMEREVIKPRLDFIESEYWRRIQGRKATQLSP